MTSKDNSSRQDIYSRITDQIVRLLEQGVKPWTQPWDAAHRRGRCLVRCGSMVKLTPGSMS